jgi:hypothetical protein
MTRTEYVRGLLALFHSALHTAPRSKAYAADRRLAAQLFDEGIDLQTVEAALLLATARRAIRPAQLVLLPPIRSLAYLLPVIREIQQQPLDPAYLDYLRRRLPISRSLFDGN